MNKFSRYIVGLFFLFLFNHGFAGAQNLVLTAVSEQPLLLQPGTVSSVVLKVSNLGDSSLSLLPQVSLPPGFQCIAGNRQLALSPREEKILVLSLIVSKSTPDSLFRVPFILVDANDSSRRGELPLLLRIGTLVNIAVSFQHTPDFLKAGTDAKAELVLRNEGNTTTTCRVYAYGLPLDARKLYKLKPGESRIIDVSVRTNDQITQPMLNSFSVKVVPLEDSLQSRNASFTIRLLPLHPPKEITWFSLPVKLSYNYLQRRSDGSRNDGQQFELSASGPLDRSGEHILNVLYRGPDQFDNSIFGLYREYHVVYQNSVMSLQYGDENYSLTPLTENGRFGTGVRLTAYRGAFTLGGFYVKPRFYPDYREEYAGFAQYATTMFSGKLHYLQIRYTANAQPANIVSAASIFRFKEVLTIEAEAARGERNKIDGNSVRGNLVFSLGNLYINSQILAADKTYPGYYNNSTVMSAAASYTLFSRLTISSSINLDTQNPSQDTLFGVAPRAKAYTAGAGLRVMDGLNVSLFYNYSAKEDRLPLNKFNYEIRQARLLIDHSFGAWGYNLNGEYGRTFNDLTPVDSNAANTYSGYGALYLSPVEGLRVSGFCNYLKTNRYSVRNLDYLYYGASILINSGRVFSMHLAFRNSFLIEEYYHNRDAFDLNVDLHLFDAHELSLDARYMFIQKELNEKDLAVQLKYTFTLEVPLKKISFAGRVKGRFVNAGVSRIDGIIVYLDGHSAISDKEGNFAFSGIRAGESVLLIDRTSVGMNDIVGDVSALKVQIRENEEASVLIPLTHAAMVKGRIEVVRKDERQASDTTAEAAPKLVLELSNENENIRIFSEEDGGFSFPYVRPGKWMLKAYDTMSDGRLVIEKKTFELALQPGETYQAAFRLVEKQRIIKFQQTIPPRGK